MKQKHCGFIHPHIGDEWLYDADEEETVGGLRGNSMKKKLNILIITIISIIVIGVIVIAFCSSPIMFFVYLITDDGGELDNVEKILAVVNENQEVLQDIVSQVLDSEYDLDFVLDIEERYFQDLSPSKDTDEEAFNLEDIYRLSDELEIKELLVYKDSVVNMVIFQTYSSGIAGSSDERGFFYLEGGVPEKIFEYNFFTIYRIYNYSEITDNWYYYDISY